MYPVSRGPPCKVLLKANTETEVKQLQVKEAKASSGSREGLSAANFENIQGKCPGQSKQGDESVQSQDRTTLNSPAVSTIATDSTASAFVSG